MKLDGKYYGEIRKCSDGEIVPPDEWILFRAKDNAVPSMLRNYLADCLMLGADQDHIDTIRDLIERVDAWRENNPDKCKVPDTDINTLHSVKVEDDDDSDSI